MKVAITLASFAKNDISPLTLLFEKGVHCVQNARGRSLEATEIISLIKDCEGIIVGTDSISAAIMALSPRLKVIACCGTVADAVDTEYASAHGISVVSTEHSAEITTEIELLTAQKLCEALNI